MLVCGDIHGHLEKAYAFLNYKPEEKHCFVGDYADSFVANDDEIITTMEMIFKSEAICLVGNHDLQYFQQSPGWTRCSGYRHESSYKFVEVMEKYKHRLKAACIDNDYFICHGGVVPEFGRAFENIQQMERYCNDELKDMINAVVPMTCRPCTFHVGRCRGGSDMFSGIFWASFGMEWFDTRFNIVCGHTHKIDVREETFMDEESGEKSHHVCVDSSMFKCFNTETGKFEDFFPAKLRAKSHILERQW